MLAPKFWGPAALGLGVSNDFRRSRFLLLFRFMVLGWLLNNRTNATTKKHWAPIVYTTLAGYSYRRGDSPFSILHTSRI